MKVPITIIFIVIIFLVAITPTFARSGCCSYHGGVRADGCGCNDGTPLSSTCAPYYTCTYSAPVYNYNPPTNTPVPPTATPYPTSTPTPTETPIPTNTPSPISNPQNTTKEVAGTNSTSSGNPIAGVFVLGVLVGLFYLGWKWIKGRSGNQKSPPSQGS